MTQIFADGFESGDKSKWDYQVGGSVTTGTTHHGNYKCEFIVTGYIQKYLDNLNVAYFRIFVRFTQLPGTGVEHTLCGMYNSGNYYHADARVINDAGTVKWRIRYFNGAHFSVTSEQQTGIVTGKWYCVELYAKGNSATEAETRMWVDGSELTDLHFTNLNNPYQINRAYIWNAIGAYDKFYADCCVIADAYIGPEFKVTTLPATEITVASAKLNGNSNKDNISRGFEWGTVQGGPYPNSWVEEGSFSAGDFNHVIEGLVKILTITEQK